jgi:hypothetical protein
MEELIVKSQYGSSNLTIQDSQAFLVVLPCIVFLGDIKQTKFLMDSWKHKDIIGHLLESIS